MSKRAYLYFWDGYRMGCRIVTHNENLETRIKAILLSGSGVGAATSLFAAYDLANDIPTEVWPPPPARTIGDYVAVAEREDNWPEGGLFRGPSPMYDFPQAGVFLVNVETGDVRITGGLGFSESVDDCNPRQLREITLATKGESVEDRDENSAPASDD